MKPVIFPDMKFQDNKKLYVLQNKKWDLPTFNFLIKTKTFQFFFVNFFNNRKAQT